MGNLNLRSVPEAICKAIRIEAAQTGSTIGAVCIKHLAHGVGLSNAVNGTGKKTTKRKAVHKIAQSIESGHTALKRIETPEDVPRLIEGVTGNLTKCAECGSLGGVHQKGCSKK